MTDTNTALRTIVSRELDHAIDSIACQRHNDGANLTGNTQITDLEWLARCLFNSSRLGAGDIRTVPWLIGREQWDELGLIPEAVFGDGPRRFDMLTDEQADAWRKLARIVMHVIPQFAERVGHRWMDQAKAIRSVWNDVREEELA